MKPETKMVKFGAVTLVFVKWQGAWVIPAKMVGLAMGYSSKGRKFVELIRGPWKKYLTFAESVTDLSDSMDGIHIDDHWLKDFRAKALDVPEDGTSEPPSKTAVNMPSLLLLTLRGAIHATKRSGAKTAKEMNAGMSDLFTELVLGQKIAKKAGPMKNLQGPYPAGPSDWPTPLSTAHVRETMQVMMDMGVMTKDEAGRVMKRILGMQMDALAKNLGVPTTVISSETKTLTKVESTEKPYHIAIATDTASAIMALNWGSKHPAFNEGWSTAKEIGELYDLSAGKVNKFIDALKMRFATDEVRANNIAEEYVIKHRSFPERDKHGFFVFTIRLSGSHFCTAIWQMREGGGVEWRNYWNVASTNAIRAEIEGDGYKLTAKYAHLGQVAVAAHLAGNKTTQAPAPVQAALPPPAEANGVPNTTP